MQALILAAGKGTRMRSSVPKVLHEVLGRPVLACVLDTLKSLGIRSPKIVIGAGADQLRSFLTAYAKSSKTSPESVVQHEQLGTGHAVMMAKKKFAALRDDLLIWPGDMPLVKKSTVEAFIQEHQRTQADVSVLSSLRLDPKGYGRILRAGGQFFAIREELDASESERRIQEVNTGIYLFKTSKLFEALKKISPKNQKKELYLTDTIEILSNEGARLEAFPLAANEEAQGINSRQDLAVAMNKIQDREIKYHQERGVTFVAPEQTFVESNVKIGQDTTIYPWSYIESDVQIGQNCQIGPFAKIRKGTQVGDGSVIGSFVEVVRSKIGKKVMAKHLSYLGDVQVGDETNIGAGTITANYDGKKKHLSRIGKRAFIGSNTVLVSPVHLGDFVKTGAGSVVTGGSRIKKGDIVAGVPAKPLKQKKQKQK